MAGIRALLLAVIGILTGARLALEGVRTRRRPVPQPAPGPVPVVAPPPPPAKSSAPGPPTNKPASAPGGAAAHTDVRKIQGGFLGYVFELFKRFGADHCPAWAAALSFFSILSFAPILICGVALLGVIIQDPQEAAKQVEKLLVNVLPGRGATQSARDIIAQANIEQSAEALIRNRGIAGLIGLLSLFWAASRIFVNASTPMNAAFGTKETRGFVTMQLYAIGMLLGAGGLFLLSLLPSAGPSLMRRIPLLSGLPDPSPWWLDVFFLLVSVAVNAVMFTVIYRFLPSPSAGITWKEARFGGVIAAVLWEALKQALAFYLTEFGGEQGYNKVYGALGGLILLILWVYYSSMILLIGAEISKLYSDAQDAKKQTA